MEDLICGAVIVAECAELPFIRHRNEIALLRNSGGRSAGDGGRKASAPDLSRVPLRVKNHFSL
jgi:hypothetical protein